MKLAALILALTALALAPPLVLASRKHERQASAARHRRALASPEDLDRFEPRGTQGLWFALSEPPLPDLRELVASVVTESEAHPSRRTAR